VDAVSEPFRVVLADPAWLFGDKLPGEGRGASKHYGCMPARDICRMPLPPIADDALLLLWRVASMQQEALDVAKAWGFVVKSEIVWEKLTKLGKPHFGMGRYVRASHEVCLVCTRGRVKVKSRSIRSRFAAPVQEHSRKPDEIYAIAEALSDGPYVELFARRRRAGWTSIGNELPAEEVAA
jgi:N6-adenosine-specific RNA methylase IME4